MKAAYTVSIIGTHGGMRHFSLGLRWLWTGAGILMLSAAVLVIGAADYLHLRKSLDCVRALDDRLLAQNRLISMQRRQIQTFAGDINALKSQMMAVDAVERKIRVIANIGDEAAPEGLFGVGGAAPDDLDANLPLAHAHGALIREMHEQTELLSAAARRQEARIGSLLGGIEDRIDQLAATPSITPVDGWTTSRFEKRTSPFTGRPEFHRAIDIAAEPGTPIVATGNGVVAFAGSKWLLGKTLVVDHGYGMVTRYAHCQKLLKKRGEAVKRGEIIALVGNTGRSTGPHVHYEVRLNGVPVNPENYILN